MSTYGDQQQIQALYDEQIQIEQGLTILNDHNGRYGDRIYCRGKGGK